MKLEKTKNYDLFVTNHEQRPINRCHAKRIGENMSIVGYLPSKPIQCYRKGQKLVVVDGHHRLEAAKSSKVDVYYVIEDEKCQQTMAAENMLVKRWVSIDFVRLYANRGNEHYKTLLSYIERGIPALMAASMLINNGAKNGNVSYAIQDGTFKVKSTELIEKVYALIEEFGDKNHAARHNMFIIAISKCILWDGFNYEWFVHRMRENPLMLEKTSNEDQMLTQIESIYNFRSRQPAPLKFEVEKAAKDRIPFGFRNANQ